MATTPRKTQTPGAKKETTTAQTSTDDVMDAVLGKADAAKEAPEKPQTAEDVLAEILSGEDLGQSEAPEGFVSVEQFDAVAAELVAARKQVVKLTGGQNQQPTTQAVAPVRKKPVLTAKGWSVED